MAFLRPGYLAGYAAADPDRRSALGLHEPNLHARTDRAMDNIDIATDTAFVDQPGRQIRRSYHSKTEFSPRLGVSYRCSTTRFFAGGYGRSYYMNPYGAGFGTQGGGWPIKQSQIDAAGQSLSTTELHARSRAGRTAGASAVSGEWQDFISRAHRAVSEYFVGVGTYPHSYNDTLQCDLEHAFPHQSPLRLLCRKHRAALVGQR